MRKYLLTAVFFVFAIVLVFVYVYKDFKSKELLFYGNVDTRTVNLGFRFLGKIESILKDEGDSVTKDEVLAALDSKNLHNNIDEVAARLEAEKIKLSKLKNGFREEEIEEALGAFEEAEANRKLMEDVFLRQELLYEYNATSKEAYLNAQYKLEAARGLTQKAYSVYLLRKNGYQKEDIDAQAALVLSLEATLRAASQDLEDSVLKSPVDGVILARLKEEGAIANPGERVFEVAKQEEYWVRAYVDEPYLGLISQGDKVFVYADVRKEPYEGIVGYISPLAEFTPKNIETMELRSDLVYHFRVLLQNPDKKIKQGMPVTIKLKK
ncbi:MAG: efflux RND transporter periplasmic adaptor subunit [Campylobacteraceae bacterium]|jgi:HlyD family secretion protein|nr:efflux RND transporter periplasmic adaptor subunit [Campylobacteraceae bacterium]